MTVFENLEFYAKIKGVKKDFLTQIVNAVIYEMKLEEFKKKMAGRLSGGNKRKLSVAISMLCNPPIILLDEPSTGMDPEARRFMWSIIHKMSIMGRKSSIIMTTHSMDEAETLCKRMGIMVNGEFACLGKAYEIKNKYGYGYELNLRIKPMSEELEDELFFNKYNIDKKMKVNIENINNILELINKKNYLDEIREGRLGQKLMRDMEKSNGISINALLNWIFFVQNAIKLIQYGKDNFSKIIVEENMDNNFLFKMKKKEEDNKSIGYLFGLFETHKEECHITEYSIQQTSLEQIFNKFAENQGSQLKERRSTIVEPGDVENIAMDAIERRKTIIYDKIVVTDNLIQKLLNDD
jgi:ATP-binding cassette subfamily A (ABC1) protein 3